MLLMIVFGERESAEGDDLRGRLLAALPGRPFLPCLGLAPLGIGVIEDERSVLTGPGPAQRVVPASENLEQFSVGYPVRIEIDLDRLGVVADGPVGRSRGRSSGIARAGADDAGQAPEPGVRAPESAEGERRRFRARRTCPVDGRPRVPTACGSD